MSPRRAFVAAMALVAAVVTTPLHAAGPETAITLVGPSGASLNLNSGELAQLAATQVTSNFISENGPRSASFEGPLLWTVLERAGVIDPAKHREQVSQTVMIVGHDGYRAVLALAEIAPEFEAKQVILADRMNGNRLGPDHFRIVVPLDKRGGRSVRDVARIEVGAPSGSQ